MQKLLSDLIANVFADLDKLDCGKPAKDAHSLWPCLAWCAVRGMTKSTDDLSQHDVAAHLEAIIAPDLALVAACLHSREEAVKQLQTMIEGLRGPLRAKYGGSRNVADEVVDELYNHLWAEAPSLADAPNLKMRLATYRGTASLRGWLKSICVRRIATLIEKNSRQESLPESVESSDNSESNSDLAEAINAAFEALPERQRLVATMYWKDGIQGREIARSLGVTPAAISQTLKAARETLGRLLEPVR